MAIIRSAKKALRQSLKRRKRNLIYKDKIKSLIKKMRFLVSRKKIKEAQSLLPQAYKALDKAAKVGVLKKHTVSRKKSNIAKLIEKSAKKP